MSKTATRSIFVIFCLILSACSLPTEVIPTNTAPVLPNVTLPPTAAPAPTPVLTPTSWLPTSAPSQLPVEPTLATGQPPATLPAPNASSGSFAVIGLASDELLNVRQTPGTSGLVVDHLIPQAAGITLSGKVVWIGPEPWVQIRRSTGDVGWIDAAYLTEYVPASTFCADTQVQYLLADLQTAVISLDSGLFASLVSPLHGLTVQYIRQGNSIQYAPEQTRAILNSSNAVDWGIQPASGAEITGSFQAVVLPALTDALNSDNTKTCNQVQMGAASYTYRWPPKFANLNYYSIYRPGPPGNEMDWRTWLVGVEYGSGKPYLFSLTQLTWEP